MFNRHYRVVKEVTTPGTADFHEMKLIESGSKAVVTKYRPISYDLTAFGVPSDLGVVLDSMFRTVDVATGETTFEWRSSEHIPPDNTSTPPRDAPIGETLWDYFHINSVDVNGNGDYLISSRHMSSIYKISGADGRILWTLGAGLNSNYRLDGFLFWA